MKIRVEDFKPSLGAAFVVTAETDAERALLWACVSDENHLIDASDESDFELVLEVSN